MVLVFIVLVISGVILQWLIHMVLVIRLPGVNGYVLYTWFCGIVLYIRRYGGILQWLPYEGFACHLSWVSNKSILLMDNFAVSRVQGNVIVLLGNEFIVSFHHLCTLCILLMITLTAIQIVLIRYQGIVLHKLPTL